VGGRIGLRTRTRYHLVGGFGTVSRRVKKALGTLSRAGWEGGSGKMARVCGRVGLGTIINDNFVCQLGNVGRPHAKE
jgi:hypothetical protein